MGGRYQAYPEYCESGVAWLGKIPGSWKSGKLRWHISIASGEAISNGDFDKNLDEPNTFPVISGKGVLGYTAIVNTNQKAIAIGRVGALCGNVHLVNQRSWITDNALKISAWKNFQDEYLFQLLTSVRLNEHASRTAQPLITGEQVKALTVTIPSIREQTQIANFLDHETAKIDTLIEKQKQLIELLKEKRRAVISHAVTKGLNPDAPMKDSGVEWLGKVPAHWGVCRAKQVSNFITSGPRGWADYLTDDGVEIFLQSGDLNDKLGLELESTKRVSPPRNAEGVRTKLQGGDVVVCITGANTGRVAIVPPLESCVYINQHLSIIRPLPLRISSKYLGVVLASWIGRSYFDVTQYGLKEGLSLSNVAEAPVSLPSMTEQIAIVEYIENVSTQYNQLENAAAQQVRLLQERRTALISAAVTGKIDVRNWEAANE